MNNLIRFALNSTHRSVRLGAFVLCAGLLIGSSLLAGDAGDGKDGKTPLEPAPEEPTYNNWIDFSLGGLIVSGDRAQFKEQTGLSSSVYGGIEDMHLEKSVGKAQLTLDGHAIFDNSDYKVKVELQQADVGYISAGYTEFRTWTDGNGGYLPPNSDLPGGQFIQLYNNDFSLDRRRIWAEMGLRVPNLPEITLRYEHDTRQGQEASTEWAPTDQTGIVNPGPNNSIERRIVPTFEDVNEKQDIVTLDAKQTFGNTDLGLGMRYEHSDMDDSLNERHLPGDGISPSVPTNAQDYHLTTDSQQKMDTYDGHFSTVTRFNDKIWLTLGFSYTTEDSSIGGGRIAGPAYGSPFIPIINNVIYSGVGDGYLDLSGGSDLTQAVGTLNLMWMPVESLTVTPSVRIASQNNDNNSSFFTENTIGIGRDPAPTLIDSSADLTTDVDGSLDLRWTGFNDWVLYATGEWSQEDEHRTDGSPSSSFMGDGNDYDLNADNSRFRQKYTGGANWYPLPRMNLAVQYYHQSENFDQTFVSETLFDDNQRLLNQTWSTDDVNFRITWRPMEALMLVSRYDFQNSSIDSRWASVNLPLPAPGNFITPDGRSGAMTDHMFTESVTWNPVNRLFIQGNLSYVLDKTTSPASSQTPGVLDFHSNYWTASAGLGFALDDKTEIRADYSYYRADDYINNADEGMPYGSGAQETSVSASVSRQLTRNVRVMLKYSYDNYRDALYGGFDNYNAQVIYSTMQVRF